jgi:hypothetical protein
VRRPAAVVDRLTEELLIRRVITDDHFLISLDILAWYRHIPLSGADLKSTP